MLLCNTENWFTSFNCWGKNGKKTFFFFHSSKLWEQNMSELNGNYYSRLCIVNKICCWEPIIRSHNISQLWAWWVIALRRPVVLFLWQIIVKTNVSMTHFWSQLWQWFSNIFFSLSVWSLFWRKHIFRDTTRTRRPHPPKKTTHNKMVTSRVCVL